jgi:hypothetical protein
MSVANRKLARAAALVLLPLWVLLSVVLQLLAQTTVGTGNIVGTVNDPSGAVVSGAAVTITNVATGQLIHLITNPLASRPR